jgi:phospholipid/cholesterol/gamma-HCH transport system substrate-binding protein
METRANYTLIGVLTLAVIAAGFLFVYFISGTNRPAGLQAFKVEFTGSVTGLARGNWVLFNGIRVGEVKDVELLPQDPSHVAALIEIDARVPVRADTRARLEYTGFTGVASIALLGGSIDAAPFRKSADGSPGLIVAERSDFQDLLETGRRVATQASDILDKTNKILDENSGSISTSVKNVQKFSDALAANADGIKQFLASMSDVGKAVGPLSAKLTTLANDSDNVIKAVDPEAVKSIVKDVANITAKLNTAADKIDPLLVNLNGFLATGDSKGAFGEITEAAKSIRKLADNLDLRTKELTVNINRFASSGLRQYEALAVDGRKTLDEINQAVRSIENNPQQFLFGKKQQIPEYNSSAR